MSFNCIFYKFSKRKNSTKIPEISGLNVVVNLKSNTSVLNPTLEVVASDDITGYNYCYIATFARYYYIEDFAWNTGGYWDISLSADPMATFRNDIWATTAYILYAQTAYNSLIVDSRLNQVTSASVHVTSGNNRIFDLDGIADRNILFFISEDTNLSSGGAVQAYLVTQSELKNVCHSLYTAGRSVWDDLQAQAGSASACITKCIRVPYSVPAGAGLSIKLGNYDTGVNGKPVLGRLLLPTVQVSIPWQASDFRKSYHKFTLILPYVGAVPISASDVLNDNILDISIAIDILTGDIVYYVCHQNDAVAPIASFKSNCASVIPISSYQSNTLSALSSIVTGASEIANGNWVRGLGSAVNGIFNFLAAKTPSVVGAQTGSPEIMSTVTLITQYYPTCVEPSNLLATQGRPYMASNSLSGFSGYIQTKDFSVTSGHGMTDRERDIINSTLDGGAFIE